MYALELFDIMTKRTFVGFLQNHVVDDAYELFDIMPERRFTLNVLQIFCYDYHDYESLIL